LISPEFDIVFLNSAETMDKPQQHTDSDDSSRSASSAEGCSPSQSGAEGFVDGLKQRWLALTISRTVENELQDCLAKIHQTELEMRRPKSSPWESHSQWLQESIGDHRLTPLENALVVIFSPQVALDRMSSKIAKLVSNLRKLVPTEYSLLQSSWDRLRKHQQLVSACEKLIKSAETEERSLKEYSDKTTLNAERLARRLERSKEESDRLIDESDRLNICAKAAQEKWQRFARLQSVRIPMLKKRLNELEVECIKMQSACYERAARLSDLTEKRMGAVLTSNNLTGSIFERMERRVQAKEAWSTKLSALIKNSEVGTKGIWPGLFARVEDAVAHSETKAKESSEALAKVPGVALDEMSEAQLRNELNLLTEVVSSLKAKRGELESSVRAIQEKVISSRDKCDESAELLLRWRGDESRAKEVETRRDIYSAQLTEFVDLMKLLETELLRMDCRIEAVQEDCERVRARLNDISQAS